MRTDLNNLGDLSDVQSYADKPALIAIQADGGAVTLSFAELDRAARRIAAILAGRGLARGARVALLGANSASYVAAYLGIMRAGLVAVPVNTRLPAAVQAFILNDSVASLVFADAENRAAVPDEIRVLALDDAALDQDAAPDMPAVRPRPGEGAMILYTSGSTGRPKGVLLSHDGQLWAVRTRAATLTDAASQRHLAAAPLYHMNALFATKLALATHGTMVLLPGFTAQGYIAAIGRWRCTALTSVPTMMARVVKESALLAATDVSSVRRVTMGSAPQTQALWDKVRAAFPGARLISGYGTTEHGPATFGPHPEGKPTPDLSLGVTLPGNEVRFTGGANEDEGVLEVRCPAVMTLYLNLPERTQRATRDGFYVTGDVMRRDADGFVFFVGRADDMFVCSGENVFPGEVERLLELHPLVHQASVVPVPDEERGQIPVAFVVPRAGAASDEAVLKRFVLENALPVMHPRRVFFRSELPLTGTNKIDREALMREARANLGC